MSTKPHDVGPHWFLPHPDCTESRRHGFRIDRPSIVDVTDGVEGHLVVPVLTDAYITASALTGDWEPIIIPKRMATKVARRKQQARGKANRTPDVPTHDETP